MYIIYSMTSHFSPKLKVGTLKDHKGSRFSYITGKHLRVYESTQSSSKILLTTALCSRITYNQTVIQDKVLKELIELILPSKKACKLKAKINGLPYLYS